MGDTIEEAFDFLLKANEGTKMSEEQFIAPIILENESILKKSSRLYCVTDQKIYVLKKAIRVELSSDAGSLYGFLQGEKSYLISKADVYSLQSNDIPKIKRKPKKELKYKKFMPLNLGIPREKMPQVSEENIDDFIIHFSDKAKVKKIKKKLKDLKPTQSEINEEKVRGFLKDRKNTNWKDRKYIMSLDGFLLDGHHSWATGLEIDEEQLVDVYRVSLPMKRLVFRTNKLKQTKNVDLNDNIKKAYDSLELMVNNPHLFSSSLSKEARLFLETIQ